MNKILYLYSYNQLANITPDLEQREITFILCHVLQMGVIMIKICYNNI